MFSVDAANDFGVWALRPLLARPTWTTSDGQVGAETSQRKIMIGADRYLLPPAQHMRLGARAPARLMGAAGSGYLSARARAIGRPEGVAGGACALNCPRRRRLEGPFELARGFIAPVARVATRLRRPPAVGRSAAAPLRVGE